MTVWTLTYAINHSEFLLGVFSSKQKAIDRVTAFCWQTPYFEDENDNNETYWNPKFRLLAVNVDTPTMRQLYAE